MVTLRGAGVVVIREIVLIMASCANNLNELFTVTVAHNVL